MAPYRNQLRPSQRFLDSAWCWVIPAIALALGAISSCSAPTSDDGTPYQRDPQEGIYDTAPVYPLKGTLGLHRDGDAFQCSICHDDYRDEVSTAALQVEHADITYKHGLDDHCLHCHHPQSPDSFIDHDGTEIPGDQSTRLCAKCHGTSFRDWRIGIHGREGGHWDSTHGPVERLVCIQCHDPHAPQFPQLKPDPPAPITRFQVDGE